MNKIEINPQEYYVWIACKDGWRRLAGHIVIINDIKFSVIMMPNKTNDGFELVFSSLESGSKFRAVPINILEVLACDTKEKTLVQYAESALVVMSAIDKFGKRKVLDVIKKAAIENKRKFGEMPEFEKIEFFS